MVVHRFVGAMAVRIWGFRGTSAVGMRNPVFMPVRMRLFGGQVVDFGCGRGFRFRGKQMVDNAHVLHGPRRARANDADHHKRCGNQSDATSLRLRPHARKQ